MIRKLIRVRWGPSLFCLGVAIATGAFVLAESAARPAGAEVVVRYLTLPGTAVSGIDGDYIDATGVLTFTHSSPTTQTFQVENSR